MFFSYLLKKKRNVTQKKNLFEKHPNSSKESRLLFTKIVIIHEQNLLLVGLYRESARNLIKEQCRMLNDEI